jgi:NADH:ubiquinone oxidoreductase subunit E
MEQCHTSSFSVVGQFWGYELKSHKIHRLHFKHMTDEYCLKLSNAARDDLLRVALAGNLQVGDWMRVSGLQEIDRKKGLKLKVYSLCRCEGPEDDIQISPEVDSKTKVLVCQKSSCCKRGGKAVLKELKQVVSDRQLEDQVILKETGCMGHCNKGPVIVINKTHYRQVSAETVSRLLEHHMKNSQ